MNRRSFLKLFGIGSASAVVAPELLVPEPEPIRRYWQVPRNAPVRGRTELKPWELFGVEAIAYQEWANVRYNVAAEPWPKNFELRPAVTASDKPIGFIESFDIETGIVMVRVTSSWNGYSLRGTA